MEGRGKSRRRNPFKVWKRRMGAVMSVILTISIIFNMPLSLADFGLHVSNAYASGSNANREDSVWATASNAKYKAGSTRDVDIYVVAEDSEAAAGNMSTMTLYLRNNTQEEISDGILKFKGNHIAKEDGYFTNIQADADAEVSVISGGTDDETEASGEGLLYQEGTLEAAGAGNLDGNADGDDANVAAAGAEMSGNAAEMSANTAERASDDADIDVDDPDADDPDAENPEDEFDEIDEGDEADEVDENDEEENHTLTDISLAPGELYEVRFEFYTDEEEKSTKAYVKFTFEGEGSEGKVKGEEKFYYSIGLPYVNIELADGYEIETGVQNEMNIWMSEPTWMDEALEERVEAIEEAKAEAEENESESDETEETAIATKSTADKASDSNADLAQPDAEQSNAQQSGTQQSNGQQSGTQQSGAQDSSADTSDTEKIEKFTQEAMTISESKVSYEVEVWGAEYKKFRPKKAEEAEDIGWISCLYQVAENTRPGVYYGKVSASGKWNQKSFTSQQGFFFEVTGEGNIVLESNAIDGMTVLVSGPVSSFPEAEELSVKVLPIAADQQAMVDEALQKKSEEEGIEISRYQAVDIRLYADGEEVEPEGEIQVTFQNTSVTEAKQEEAQAESQIALMSAVEEEETTTQDEAVKVYHLDEDEVVANEMESEVADGGDVVMTTDHFSVYIISVQTDGTYEKIQLTLEHYAYLSVLAENPEAEFYDKGGNSENTLKLKHDENVFYEIYEADTYELPEWQKVNISDLSKVAKAGAYEISKVYLLKDGATKSDNMNDTNVWQEISPSENLETVIKKDSTIRIVYSPLESVSDKDATFYDYTVWEGRKNLINSPDNFQGKEDKIWVGIGNYNDPTDASQYRAYYPYWGNEDSPFKNTINVWKESESKAVKNFVTGFENGNLVYKDDAYADAGLFDDSVPGVEQIDGYQLRFKKNGDTYILTNVLDDDNNPVFSAREKHELDGFHVEKSGTAKRIYTNGFWALDGVDGATMETSLDTNKHNWFFGMQYNFTFTLGDYTGPLTYYFRGDDDFWLFVDGNLVVDLGGIHDPVGQKIDLSTVIDMKDKETPHKINIVYLERGGNASTCYMEFTLPNIEAVPPVDPVNQTSLTVTKTWDDYNNPFRPTSIMLQLQYRARNTTGVWRDWGTEKAVKPDASGNWSYTWTGLPRTQDFEFQVVEEVPTGYTVTYPSSPAVLENGQYTYEITNKISETPPLKSIQVKKQWQDGSGNVLEVYPFEVSVQLYWKGVNEQNTSWKPVEGKNVILNDANQWSYIFTELPAKVEYLGAVYDAVYTVFEINAEGKKIDGGGKLEASVEQNKYIYTVEYTRGENTEKNIPIVTITNKTVSADLTIRKIRATDNAVISDAVEFSLLKTDTGNSSQTPISGQTSNGTLEFKGLLPGSYTLTETKPAPGYNTPSNSWDFTVTEEGTIQFTNTEDASYDSTTKTMTIKNYPGAELPETGGPGLIMIERFGWILLLLAMLGAEIQIFGSKWRREE